jgi:uncharacterized protein YceK
MRFLLIALAILPLSGCEMLHSEDKEKARALLEACMREAWTQGETAGKLGIACAAMNDWMRQQGWHAQP